jgi:hypothetical protein
MIYIITICVLSVLVVILLFTTFNLLKKNEKQEDVLLGYMEYLDKLSRVIEASDEKIKEIDSRGIFENDDEVGFIYKEIKKLQKILSDFNVRKYEI